MYRKLPLASAGIALMMAASMSLPGTAQTSGTAQQQQNGSQAAAAPAQSNMNPADNSSYATGQPLEMKSKEGFWGHMNPFARKKWVNRQLSPVKGRLNELDQLQAKNANDIQALDAKTAAGIHQAQSTADQANQTASAANSSAGQAQQLAGQANTQVTQTTTTVSGLDQYNKVSDTELRFRSGQTMLNARAKQALDQVAQQLQGQKGYLVEVQGYSHLRGQAGIASSQRMANDVVRYLIEQHQVPVYKIRQIALGDAPLADGSRPASGSTVRVSVVENSLAASGPAAGASASAAPGNAAPTSGPTQ